MNALRLFLPLLLLLAIAAPVAAEESPVPSEEPVPMLLAAPADGTVTTPCSDEVAAAVAAGSETGPIAEPCLLPDGSVLPMNVMTINGGVATPMPASEAPAESTEPLPALLAEGDEGAGDMDLLPIAGALGVVALVGAVISMLMRRRKSAA